MLSVLDLVVPNVADFNLRHPRLKFDPATLNSVLEFGRAMADQSVFWSDRPRVLILPAGVDKVWFADVHGALGSDLPPLICPTWRTGYIIADLLTDPVAMASLQRHLHGWDQVQFLSWGATEDLYRLAAAVRSFGHEVLLDVPPEDRYWSSLYLDSKLSSLDLATQVPGLRVAPCMTTDTWEELRGILNLMVENGQTAIVRSAYGVTGTGSAIVDGKAGSLQRFWRSVRNDPLLQIFPLLVQSYLTHQAGLGCPVVNMYITDEGITGLIPSVATVDRCRQVSVNVGDGVLPSGIMEHITDVSKGVAAAARRLGYRGWFGIDFVVDDQGELYVTEFNARRTTSSEWMSLLNRSRFSRPAVVHSSGAVPPESAPAKVSYTDVRKIFRNLWDEGAIVYPSAVRNLSYPHRLRSYSIVAGGVNAFEAERNAVTVRESIDSLFSDAGDGIH
jgi:hypothetical protein